MKMLRTPIVHGVGETESSNLHQTWDTIGWAMKQMEDMGIAPLEEPDFPCPVIEPGSLLNLSAEEYTIVYERLLNWYGYLAERLAYAKAMVLQASNEMELIEVMTKKNMLNAPGKKPTAEYMRMTIETDPRHQELRLTHQRWKQLQDLLQGRMDTVDANLRTVSRHIEIRKIELEGHKIASNISNRGAIRRSGLSR